MNKEIPPPPTSEFTGKDAESLIAGYGKTVDPARKADLLSKLEGERAAFAKMAKPNENSTQSGRDRGRS